MIPRTRRPPSAGSSGSSTWPRTPRPRWGSTARSSATTSCPSTPACADLSYFALARGGKNRAGIYPTPWKELNSNWLPYVLVADAAAAAEKAKALGGRVVLAPRADIRDGSLAIVVDPTGAALALQKFPFGKNGK